MLRKELLCGWLIGLAVVGPLLAMITMDRAN
jgi:hypothetical protein